MIHARPSDSRLRRAVVWSAIGGVALGLLCLGALSVAASFQPAVINVRWSPDVSDLQRIELERRFHLEEGRAVEGADLTWGYRLTDVSRANVRALLQDHRVADTHHLDRSHFRPEGAREQSQRNRTYAAAAGATGALLLLAWFLGPQRLRTVSVSRPAARLRAGQPEWHHRAALLVAATTIAVAGFALRLLSLDAFDADHYMHLAWSQQLLAGAVPNQHFIDPGFLLTYSLSALAQLVRPGPLSEAVLNAAMLAVAAALTVLVVERVTGSIAAAIGAGTFCVIVSPALFNYPKFIAPAGALWLLARHVASPSGERVAAMAAWATASFLFRYDLGLHVAAGTLCGLLAAHWAAPPMARRWIAWYVTVGILAVLPYLAFLQWTGGIAEAIRSTIEFTSQETPPLDIAAPPFPFWSTWSLRSWNDLDSAATLFYLFYLLAPVALAVLAFTWRAQRPGATALMTTAVVLLTTYDVFVLRDPISKRVQDVGVPVAVVGAWLCWNAVRSAAASRGLSRVMRVVAAAAMLVLAGAASGSALTLSGRIYVPTGWNDLREHATAIVERTRTWGPLFWPHGSEIPDAIGYLRRCTSPSDHLFVTGVQPEYYLFAGRPFAGGLVLFRAFSSARDQELIVSRIQQRSVPVVLIDPGDPGAYSVIAAYLRDRYVPVGESMGVRYPLTVAVDKDLRATRSDEATGWPCGFVRTGSTGLR